MGFSHVNTKRYGQFIVFEYHKLHFRRLFFFFNVTKRYKIRAKHFASLDSTEFRRILFRTTIDGIVRNITYPYFVVVVILELT